MDVVGSGLLFWRDELVTHTHAHISQTLTDHPRNRDTYMPLTLKYSSLLPVLTVLDKYHPGWNGFQTFRASGGSAVLTRTWLGFSVHEKRKGRAYAFPDSRTSRTVYLEVSSPVIQEVLQASPTSYLATIRKLKICFPSPANTACPPSL